MRLITNYWLNKLEQKMRSRYLKTSASDRRAPLWAWCYWITSKTSQTRILTTTGLFLDIEMPFKSIFDWLFVYYSVQNIWPKCSKSHQRKQTVYQIVPQEKATFMLQAGWWGDGKTQSWSCNQGQATVSIHMILTLIPELHGQIDHCSKQLSNLDQGLSQVCILRRRFELRMVDSKSTVITTSLSEIWHWTSLFGSVKQTLYPGTVYMLSS